MNETLKFPKDPTQNIIKLVNGEETSYDKQIQYAAENIDTKNARFVFLAGPSCSGKTTTAQRLEKALLEKGKKVFSFSTDDFFFEQSRAPLNEDGTPNYDAFEHTDSDLIISVLNDFAQGKKTKVPTFNFLLGARGEFLEIDGKDYDIFLLEGIHALNDKILSSVDEKIPYLGFYLDVTKSVGMEGKEEVLSPVDIRFCRRMIRDYKHRNASVDLTYRLWKNVRKAESEILHPFQKNAFFTISTSFSYEIPVEKEEVLPLLESVEESHPLFPEAKRLLSILTQFPSLPESIVPKTSVLREFID